MATWFILLLAVLGIIILYKLVTFKHRKTRKSLIIFLIIIGIFLASFYFVSKDRGVDMTTMKGFGDGFKEYGIWIYNGIAGLGSVTGNFAGVDTNKTNKTVETLRKVSSSAGDVAKDVVKEGAKKTKSLMVPKKIEK
ncbi:hypothetical protein GOV12_06895 [Candidatus Pacearchaeota archaeon]|nr:hypothetical protein [Candidatus Pacearchaeota archaeon]